MRKTNKRTTHNKKITAKRRYYFGGKLAAIDNKKKSHIVQTFLEMLNMIKLDHWKTQSFAQHKATDELHEKLSENIDKFVEILMGKDTKRIHMVSKKLDVIDLDNVRELKTHLFEYRAFFLDMNTTFDMKKDSDLLNIRDEIVGDINQFLYLLTLA